MARAKARKFTQEEHEFLREFVPGHTHKEIREEFLKRFGGEVASSFPGPYIKRHGLRTGFDGRFPKGHVPANKGKKMSPETYAKCAPTMFKKGQPSLNSAPIGTETIKGTGDYIYVKIDDDPTVPSRKNWKQKHHLIYEEHYGPIPEGYIVIFLDGNNRNFAPENLRAISKATNARMSQNHLRFDDPELTDTGVNVAEMLTEVGRRNKK